jgi:myosin heavy subunit
MPKKSKAEVFQDPSDDEGEKTPTPAPVPVVEEVKPIKKVRKKRVLTEEQKEKLKANLAKGRATSLANRQRKAKLKEIEKLEKVTEQDKKIKKHIEEKEKKARTNDNYEAEIAELKRQLAAKPKTMPKIEEEEPVVNKVVKRKPKAKVSEPPAPVAIEPAPASEPPAPRKKRRACGVAGLGLLRHMNSF